MYLVNFQSGLKRLDGAEESEWYQRLFLENVPVLIYYLPHESEPRSRHQL